MLQNAPFLNLIGGNTPEPASREGATSSRAYPHGRPTALRASGRPAAAALPIAGTQNIELPLGLELPPPTSDAGLLD